MAQRLSQPESVHVLIGSAHWAWPQAVAELFQPRGVSALVADTAEEMVRLVANNRFHLAILDMAMGGLSGMQAIKMIRNCDRLLPCILLSQQVDERLLTQALALDVFSVLGKPVDLGMLAEQLHRLFTKYYASNVFSDAGPPRGAGASAAPRPLRIATVIRWTRDRSGKETRRT
jgi:CheY-like chemotaxis protein